MRDGEASTGPGGVVGLLLALLKRSVYLEVGAPEWTVESGQSPNGDPRRAAVSFGVTLRSKTSDKAVLMRARIVITP